ncbi:adenosine deaminase [Coleofasciculus sp. FACHB-712]|uniref:adenosine deaminase n=1 Tax=Coleofasciculus sp. FACHB-712 TaxID=2692789 RepID=UPI001682AB64|nr:adenosine deaminase [Coleofasciculus sp. FACHB-712]MBD1943591.1 adenosine deaminase [Coleofasciculus sp. FACHB-712]
MLLNDTLHQLPKVELHLHLEGAIPLTALWQLIEKYNAVSSVGSFSQMEQKFQYKDFQHFIDTWVWKNNFLREYEDFTLIASKVAEDLASQNIIYVEAFYSPGDFIRHGLEPQKLTEAIRKGLDVHADKITVNLVADLIRDFGPEQGMTWVKQIHEVKNLGVLGIGIGGSEQTFPPEPYEAVYEQARNLGFKTSAHAGEAAGSESIWGAIRSLKVDRIGHGVRAIDDPELVSFLKSEQIPIEMCPISNLRTGVVADISLHPIKKLYEEGLLITVNTDDPKMFNSSLAYEYKMLVEKLGFSLDDIVNLIKNAIKSSWCDDTEKMELLRKIETAPPLINS